MKRQTQSEEREELIAMAIKDVAAELRLVELADYAAFIRLELFGNLADLVASAAELFFFPGALSFGHGADAELAWGGEPRIVLDMQFRGDGVTVYFRLVMEAEKAGIEVSYVTFEAPSESPAENTVALKRALANARRPAAAARPHPESERVSAA